MGRSDFLIISSCQRHPLSVVLLDQIRSLHLETHRDDPPLDRAASELRWTLGLLDHLFLPASSVNRCSAGSDPFASP